MRSPYLRRMLRANILGCSILLLLLDTRFPCYNNLLHFDLYFSSMLINVFLLRVLVR